MPSPAPKNFKNVPLCKDIVGETRLAAFAISYYSRRKYNGCWRAPRAVSLRAGF